MKTLTRRSLIQGSAVAVAGTMLSSPLTGMSGSNEAFHEFCAQEDHTRQLIEAAVDAARKAGAHYADARLTFTQYKGSDWPRAELGFGVRALVDGYWGFSGSPIWNLVEAARQGRAAVGNAKANFLGQARDMVMAPNVSPESGSWSMPVKDDPFEMPSEEISDLFGGLNTYFKRKPFAMFARGSVEFHRQQKVFGSTEGQITSQRTYRTGGVVDIMIYKDGKRWPADLSNYISRVGAGLGFEYFRDQPLRQYIDEAYDELLRDVSLPIIPVDVGKYPMLLDGIGVADCIKSCIGSASEVDRAMGFEANGGGTSYITDPDTMLGTLKLGSPAWNISASRSTAGGLSTVRWDDEGVKPRDFEIVRNGILVDMQTDRENAGYLRPYYERNNMPFLSQGCAQASDAINVPLVRCADLTVSPDPSPSITVNELRNQIEDGVEWRMPYHSFDFQLATALSRMGKYMPWKIKNGKRVAKIANVGMLFRTSELLENLVQLGGPETVLNNGDGSGKGQPDQASFSTTSSPAALFKDMTIIDITRKA